MSYQVLARKWRPRNFREMVGQEHVLQALVNALDHDRLHHAYLFTGTRGVGKTTIARILAKCLNCETGVSSEPCGKCSSCLEIAEGRSVDLIEVDAASRTKVEDTRELLENVQYAPTRSRYKVYLIDEVHMLSSHSFNALLKTLEEPPPHVKFLLATTDPQRLPATILSRCLQFNLKNMPPEQIVGHLQRVLAEESVDFEEPALWLLARAAQGSMRDALSLTDQAIAFGSGRLLEEDVSGMLGTVDRSFVYQLLDAVAADEPSGALAVVARMAEHAPDFEASLDELASLLHRVALAQAVPDAVSNSWGDADKVTALAASLSGEDVQLFYQVALNGKRDLRLAADPRAGFEMCLLRMISFRPVEVLDTALSASDLVALEPAAPEVGEPAKKLEAEPALESPAKQPEIPAAPPIQEQTAPPIQKQTAPPAQNQAAESPGAGADALASLSSLDAAGWPDLLDSLGLMGMVYSVASHCELLARSEDRLAFRLDEANSSLFNDGHRDKLRMALENYFATSLSVTVEVGAVVGETPAMRRHQRQEQRRQQAVKDIQSDSALAALIEHFDGELDPASIVPLDT
ncbi:MAG: DNA polymerase III subunit gamma/tau [Pseudomonadota bacterium]